MVDIQSLTAENRRGKKEERKRKIETIAATYNGLSISTGGHKECFADVKVLQLLPTPLPGLCTWTPLGDFCPTDLLLLTPSKSLSHPALVPH